MKRITVKKRGKYSYIAFKDGSPFEWATGYSKINAINKLKELYPCLNKEEGFKYCKRIYLL